MIAPSSPRPAKATGFPVSGYFERQSMVKHIISSLVVSAAVIAGFSGTSAAADLDRIIYSPEIDRTRPVEIGNGWYLRGDIGYAVDDETGNGDFDSFRMKSEVSGGLGVGYQWTDLIRTDLTADYMKGDAEGVVAGGFCNVAQPCGYDAFALLANAYVDLGTIAGSTPYVGAGAGYTYSGFDDVEVGVARFGGGDDWRFTYALMAGVSYDVSKSLKVDFGYRYMDVDGGAVVDTLAGTIDDDGFTRHEVRAGLRYSLW
jgi:opacity protein-like surface antigen